MFSFLTALEKDICLLACSVILSANTLLAQPYYFKHYQVEDGLANNRVLCSLQDSKGFMWFGTVQGLCRFDGYTFKTFQKNRLDNTALQGNYITCLYEDAKEQLWIGTAEGLHQYTAATESFSLLRGTENKFIREVTADKAGNLWFIASINSHSYDNNAFTLFRYNTITNTFKPYKKEVIEPTSICAAAGTIWAATSLGLLKKFNESQDGFRTYNVC
jgi:ligand-binding sensor domain-containing protein